jgi:hypothetical protein
MPEQEGIELRWILAVVRLAVADRGLLLAGAAFFACCDPRL